MRSRPASDSVATGLVVGYEAFLRFGVAGVPADILHFGLRPWDGSRLAIVTGLVLRNGAFLAGLIEAAGETSLRAPGLLQGRSLSTLNVARIMSRWIS